MKETERIIQQLERAYGHGAWHGPSVCETLEGISAEQAAARPIAGAHSIWELALHIAAWKSAARRRLEGDRAELTSEEDWPPVMDDSESAWAETKKALEQAHGALVSAISRLDDANLDEAILPGMSSVYVTLHGLIQHDIYHAGQIAILKKAQSI